MSKLSIDVDFQNKYDNAKKDLIKALVSFDDLTPQMQHQLVKEIFGAAQVDFVIHIMQSFSKKGGI